MRKILLVALSMNSLVLVCAQDIEGILRRHYEAYNQVFWDEVNSVTAEGVWFNGNEKLYMKMFAKKPANIAIKGTYEGHEYAEVSGTWGHWTLAPWTGLKKIQLMLPQEELLLQHLFSFGSPIPRDAVLEYMGAVKENGIPSYWLRENRADTEIDYFIDRHDYFLRKRNIRKLINGRTEPLTQTYDQFRAYGDFSLPLVTVIKTTKLDREYVMDEIYIGDGIADGVYQRPQDDD